MKAVALLLFALSLAACAETTTGRRVDAPRPALDDEALRHPVRKSL